MLLGCELHYLPTTPCHAAPRHRQHSLAGFRSDYFHRNIWSPTENRELVAALAQKYKFSTRLGGTILGWDEARRQVNEKLKRSMQSTPGALKTADSGRPRKRRTFGVKVTDLEKAMTDPGAERRAAAARAGQLIPELHTEDLHMYKLLQEQYNYTTIDHGSNCRFILKPHWR